MAAEDASRDNNRTTVAMGVTNDASLFPTMLRVDASTLRLLVNATITGTVTTTGGTEYTEGDTDTTFTGPVVLTEGPSNTAAPLQSNAAKDLLVSLDGESVTVTATNLDIRDLTSVSDSVSAVQSGTWTVDLGATDNAVLDAIAASVAAIDTDTTTIIGHVDGIEGLLTTIDADTSILSATDFMLGADFSNVFGTGSLLITTQADDIVNTQDTIATTAFGQYFDGSTWDRMRGDATDGLLVNLGANNDVSVSGSVAVTNAGLTELAAAINASSQMDVNIAASAVDIMLGTDFSNVLGTASLIIATQADDIANTQDTLATTAFLQLFDGTTWDRARGDSTDGLLVNLGTNNDVTITTLPGDVEADIDQIRDQIDLITPDIEEIRVDADAIRVATEIMDDWDESDRAKVNLIVGQAGVAAGAGATGATVQRVVQANNAGKTLVAISGQASSSGDNTILAAGTNKTKVYAFSISTVSTTAVTCIFQDGAAGTGFGGSGLSGVKNGTHGSHRLLFPSA